jgi:deazaflavin-dependent oxidoreductase (nitroreductase family)
VWSVAALRLLRLANPFVRGLLDSRAHGILSGRLVLLEYSGRRSGRTFRIPLRYAPTSDGAVVAVALRPERKQWWRAFTPCGRATLMLRGAVVSADGVLAAGEARAAALEAYLRRYPRSRSVAQDAAVVVFRPVDG